MPLQLKVWGDYACFTRPEMKVERVTYPVMTPSAARGLLEAIYWKPECTWRVREIQVLKPITYVSLLRNEVNDRQTFDTAQGWAKAGGRGGYDATEHRAQRHTLALRDVAYLITADVVPRNQPEADAAKHRDQFRRRVERGQSFATPVLGTREFAAFFGPPDGTERPIQRTEALGRMLFDLRFENGRAATPLFFDAELQGGVLRVPGHLYAQREQGSA